MIERLKPRRRWFRFSLRTLFVALTVLCLWFGWNVNVVQQRSRLRKQQQYEMANHHREWQFTFINDYSAPPTPPAKTNNSGDSEVRYFIQRQTYEAFVKLKKRATPPSASKELSQLRKWLGDEAVDLIVVFNQSDHDLARARFPEAFVHQEPPRQVSNPQRGEKTPNSD